MRSRWRRARARAVAAWHWIGGAIEGAELFTFVGLALIWYGLHQVSPAAAYTVCGVVILWCALPERPPFIDRPKDGR